MTTTEQLLSDIRDRLDTLTLCVQLCAGLLAGIGAGTTIYAIWGMR